MRNFFDVHPAFGRNDHRNAACGAVNQHRQVEKGLRQALANDEFELYFQGQYDTDERLVGAETLRFVMGPAAD